MKQLIFYTVIFVTKENALKSESPSYCKQFFCRGEAVTIMVTTITIKYNIGAFDSAQFESKL